MEADPSAFSRETARVSSTSAAEVVSSESCQVESDNSAGTGSGLRHHGHNDGSVSSSRGVGVTSSGPELYKYSDDFEKREDSEGDGTVAPSTDDFENNTESENDIVASLPTAQAPQPRGAGSWANTKEALTAGISEDMIRDFSKLLLTTDCPSEEDNWNATKKAFEILFEMRHDKTGPYTADDFRRDTQAVWTKMQNETPTKYKLNPYTRSAINYLKQLQNLEDATERAENLAEADRLKRHNVWGRAQVFLIIVPPIVLFCGVVMGTVCRSFVQERSLAVAGLCTINDIAYRDFGQPCVCGTCKGRTTKTCYNTYPCLIVNVTYTNEDRQIVSFGHLGGRNRSTPCAKDVLIPCHMETYANDYEVGEFERQLTTNFTCYRHERYPTQFVLPEDLAVPRYADVFNCFFWPTTLLIVCVIWFVLAILQILWERMCPDWKLPSITCKKLRQEEHSSVKIPVIVEGENLFLEMPVEQQFDNKVSLQEYTTKVRRQSLARSSRRMQTAATPSAMERLTECESQEPFLDNLCDDQPTVEYGPSDAIHHDPHLMIHSPTLDYEESEERVLAVVDY